jgi:hypothetical protein
MEEGTFVSLPPSLRACVTGFGGAHPFLLDRCRSYLVVLAPTENNNNHNSSVMGLLFCRHRRRRGYGGVVVVALQDR